MYLVCRLLLECFVHTHDLHSFPTRRSSDLDLLTLTTEIVAAHVSNNNVAVSDLPTLINQIYNSLANIDTAPAAPAARPQPAISVKKSVQPEIGRAHV